MNINHTLATRSDFSIGESMIQIDQLVSKAKELGYETVTLMDTMSIHGMVDFTNRAVKLGIKPIIGCRIAVCTDPLYRPPPKKSGIPVMDNPVSHIKIYVKNETGLASLMKLLSKGNARDYFYYHSRVGWNDIFELTGVAVSTGDFNSIWSRDDATDIFKSLQESLGKENVFIELCPVNTPLFDTLNFKAITAANTIPGARTLVTYPVLYLDDADHDTLDILGCIASQTKRSLPYRPIQFVKNFSFQKPKVTARHMVDAVARQAKFYNAPYAEPWRNGLENIQTLVDMCTYRFKKAPVSLPIMSENEFDTLGRKCIEGWKNRFSKPVLGHMPDPSDYPTYQKRLRFELSILKKMGFAGYFLLVEDLVNWAKNNDIIVGPGRGSVGGSLVAYLIGITDVDPIRFNLLFERFINPERMDLPDADLDFMSSKRHLVIEYLYNKYGSDRVAGISNFSTLASASALRDTGRTFDLTPLDMVATKLVPKEHGQPVTLTAAASAVPEIDKFKTTYPEVWRHAVKLEGVMRSFGRHAAGVVVAGEPLINRAVVDSRDDESTVPAVCWDKRVVEDFGLVKMDILGLSTLDVLEIARQYIKERHGKSVVYVELPLEEERVMKSFARGDTTGVFQFESVGMSKLLRDIGSVGDITFEDITAATALYRPGPMDSGLMDDFVQIKKGIKDPFYEHPNMRDALKDTYGVIVYQEQVMQLAVDLAGFTHAEADHLRKAMGKKDKDKMAAMRDQWIDGCERMSGMKAYEAGELFDKIEAFAGYGFNRSHAVEYSVISYWSMWVRVNYPAEYFAACLSIAKEEKLTGLVIDARKYGIELLPPDVNLSSNRYTIPNDKHILAPFSSVKGISENTAIRIAELRLKQPTGKFETPEAFRNAAAVKGSKVNATVVKNLEAVGAFASIDSTSVGARDLSRRKIQIELMPDLIVDAVKADRQTDVSDKFLKAKIIHLVQDYKACEGCDLASEPHPSVQMKSMVKFMVVSDCPSWQEEKAGKLLQGDAADFVKMAISEAGLKPSDGYYTTLVKAKKSDKFLSNAQINGCSKFLDRELELIKPAIIVALGSASIKRFVPGIKGGVGELAGKVIYDAKLDASIVCGLNAQQILFDATKMEILQGVFEKVAEIIA